MMIKQNLLRSLHLSRGLGAIGALTIAPLLAPPADAIPPRSLTTQARGFVQVNEPIPWVAGRDVNGAAHNLNALLKGKREVASAQSVYLLLCHTAIRECSASVRFLHNLRGRFESEGIDVVVVFTEDIEAQTLQKWLSLRNVTPSDHFHILIDRYHRSALRLGAYQKQRQSEDDSARAQSEGGAGESDVAASAVAQRNADSPRMSKLKRELKVPLGVLMDVDGRVMMIVVQEGADLSEKITQTLRYQGVSSSPQEEPDD